jgi:hypothetical protein
MADDGTGRRVSRLRWGGVYIDARPEEKKIS